MSFFNAALTAAESLKILAIAGSNITTSVTRVQYKDINE